MIGPADSSTASYLTQTQYVPPQVRTLQKNRFFDWNFTGAECGTHEEKAMTIREAHLGDLDSLVDFNIAMALETEAKRLHRYTVKAGVAGCIEVPSRGFYLVAERDGRLVGSLLITREWSDWRNGDFWWIQSVYVIPEFRKTGVFRSLHHEARQRALASGEVCGLRLYVEKHNQSAQDVYLKLGLSETDYRFYEEEFFGPENLL